MSPNVKFSLLAYFFEKTRKKIILAPLIAGNFHSRTEALLKGKPTIIHTKYNWQSHLLHCLYNSWFKFIFQKCSQKNHNDLEHNTSIPIHSWSSAAQGNSQSFIMLSALFPKTISLTTPCQLHMLVLGRAQKEMVWSVLRNSVRIFFDRLW